MNVDSFVAPLEDTIADECQKVDQQTIFNDGFPEPFDLWDLLKQTIEEQKHLIQNLLRKRQVAIVSGAAKTHKSWTAMELALAVSQGSAFLKWKSNSGRVFYVDTELEKYDFKQRIRTIAKAKGYSVGRKEITPMLLRAKRTNLDALVPVLKKRAIGYDLICIDAIYSVLGDREENSNEDIAQIGGLLFELAEETGAAVLFTHHFSKGSQSGKRGIEKASGAGAWGRFPDVSLAIDKHPEEGCYNFELVTRAFAPESPFVARRTGCIWQVEAGLKVETIGSSSDRSGITDIIDILINECNGETSPGNWASICQERLGISRKSFDARKRKAMDRKLVVQTGNTNNTVCRIAENVRKDPNSNQYVGSKIKVF
jgi:hypothetical protein